MKEDGMYLYCIIDSGEEKQFNSPGIAKDNGIVHTVPFSDIAAVVSKSPIIKYDITRENLLAHQLVMEEALREQVVLPVRFGTICEKENELKERVLKTRYSEFKELFLNFQGKKEFGLKALWINMNEIYKEILNENCKIKSLKGELEGKSAEKTLNERITLGKMVESALSAKREKEAKKLLENLKKLSVKHKENSLISDKMVFNFAFLAECSKEKEVDDEIERLISQYENRIRFKYVGPVPLCNFVEIVITFDDHVVDLEDLVDPGRAGRVEDPCGTKC